MSSDKIDLDDEMARLVQQLASNQPCPSHAATEVTIERLRRLEDEARSAGTSRQAFQKIVSARRVLGDRVDFGPAPAFTGRENAIRPVPEELRIPVYIAHREA